MFDDLTDVYEAMIDWPKRLAHETPFYRRLFDKHGVHSVADVACGTGRHAAQFHSWGLRVDGTDISPAMIDRAKNQFGEPSGLRWAARSFDQPIAFVEPFDAVVCVGNSLALAPDRATIERAIGHMLAAVRSGGIVVVHVMNLWHLPDGPCVWQKCLRMTLAQGDVLMIKGVHRSGGHGFVDLLVSRLTEPVAMQSESLPLIGLDTAELEAIACNAGGGEIAFFGSYRDDAYDREKSVDLIMVAEKR